MKNDRLQNEACLQNTRIPNQTILTTATTLLLVLVICNTITSNICRAPIIDTMAHTTETEISINFIFSLCRIILSFSFETREIGIE